MVKPGLPPVCAKLGRNYITGQCSHGNLYRRPLGCRDYENCEPCLNEYITKIRQRIRDGIDHTPVRGYLFATFTLCRHAGVQPNQRCPQCRQPYSRLKHPTLWTILNAWKRLRKRFPGIRFFRILEPHKNGVPHLHAVIDADTCSMPLVSKARRSESLANFVRRQRPNARHFIRQVQNSGFGTICDVQQAYANGHGAAKYLTSYLTNNRAQGKNIWDSIRTMQHPTGRRARLYGSSTSWSATPGVPDFAYAGEYNVTKTAETATAHCDDCEKENQLTGYQQTAAVNARIRRWLRPLHGSLATVVENWYALRLHDSRTHAEYATRRDAIDAGLSRFGLQPDAGVPDYPAKPGRRAEDYLRLLRLHGYAGPVGLLDGCARALYHPRPGQRLPTGLGLPQRPPRILPRLRRHYLTEGYTVNQLTGEMRLE